MIYKYLVSVLCLALLGGCAGASSRQYKPLEWEKPLFAESIKSVFPSDLRAKPDDYKGKLIHLVGTIKDFKLTNGSPRILELTLDQKHYDYIEDFSIQTETIFLSSAGEGLFCLIIESKSPLSYKEHSNQLADMVSREDLAFVYGEFKGLDNGDPVLIGKGLRTIHEKYYSTNIFYYEIKRNAKGGVEVNDDGLPVLTNFELLNVAGPGEND